MLRKLFLLLLVFPVFSYGADDSLRYSKSPINIQFQYAGNLGLVSAGAGKLFFDDRFYLHLIYGFLPKSINGTNVHTISVKSSYQFGRLFLEPDNYRLGFYSGFALLYGITQKTYLKLPDYFPNDYYDPNAVHATFFLGSRLTKNVNKRKVKAISLFMEIGSIDHHLWHAIQNKYIGFWDVWNMSFGMAFTFK